MKFYTVTYLIGDDVSNSKNLRVVHVEANDVLEAWDKSTIKAGGEVWLLSIFEGKHKDLSKEIE